MLNQSRTRDKKKKRILTDAFFLVAAVGAVVVPVAPPVLGDALVAPAPEPVARAVLLVDAARAVRVPVAHPALF
jgi:hypothetical protein